MKTAIALFAALSLVLLVFKTWAPETARQVNYLLATGERP